jgi:hypothetical protein
MGAGVCGRYVGPAGPTTSWPASRTPPRARPPRTPGRRYHPAQGSLELYTIFKSGGRFDGPDNITVSPYGGGEQYLVGTTRQGKPFAIGRNAFNDGELTCVTFSDDGRTLFANRQEPGVTFAITGSWQHIRR